MPDRSGVVGCIGLGDMGAPMAERILEKGFSVVVFDVRSDAISRLSSAGAEGANTAMEVAKRADVINVCVVDDQQVLDVVESMASVLKPSAVVIVTSSVRPETIQRAAAIVRAAGGSLLDAAVSGSRPAVLAGTLTVMVGGEVEVLKRVQPVLSSFGSNIVHVGPLGAGQAMKIANNMMLHMNHLVALEALQFALSQGITEESLLHVVNLSTGRSWVTETWGLLDDMLRDHPQAGTPGIYDMMIKEMWSGVILSKQTHTPLPLTGLGVQVGIASLQERDISLRRISGQN